MKIAPFEMERWQSVWENRVELNISESGVLPMSVNELVNDPDELRRVLSVPLAYPQTNGSEEVRARIAALYPGAKTENILVTCGCSEANYITTWALIERGDEVVIVQPNYMQIAGVAPAFGATLKRWWLQEKLSWAPDTAELGRLVTPKTKLIAVCNPNNPTGAILGEKEMDDICGAAARVGAWLLADEVYRGAEFSGPETATFYGRYERVIVTCGLSKAYALPGLRTGWVAGPHDFVEKLWGYHDYTSIGPAMLTDRLVALALEPARRMRILDRTRGILRENYALVRDWVERHPSLLTHVPPAAGAIAWVGLKDGRTSAELADAARTKKSVLLVPGSQFEMEGFLRIGFGYSADNLRRALVRLDELFEEGGRGA